jgi:hypothetical protein
MRARSGVVRRTPVSLERTLEHIPALEHRLDASELARITRVEGEPQHRHAVVAGIT